MDPQLPSALAADAKFTGCVHIIAPARVDGCIEGEISAVGALWIGPTAVIRARVSAPEIVVEGTLEGELHATGRIDVHSTARIVANVTTPSLNVEEGAILQGRCVASRQELD